MDEQISDAKHTQMATNRHIVAPAADLPPGSRKIVTIDGREIGVFNVNGSFYALRNLCPHRSGPLCKGRLRPLVVVTELYQLGHEREGEILKCPWHQWEFDIKTGQALYDERLRVKTYTVVQEGDEVVLYL
jgi:3-phenylpropionate/trans-cinnamate dioxygenase ferredoxin subunit